VIHRIWLQAGWRIFLLLAYLSGFWAPGRLGADDSSTVRDFLANISKRAAESEKASQAVVTGEDGWLFFVPELKALVVGRFWGDEATRVSRASKPEYADPLPAIVDFHEQLRTAGIELLVVPVPAKAAVYPESVSSKIAAPGGKIRARIDESHREFYKLLKQQGVTVIDLLPLYLAHRDDGGPLYCKTDSHWSGRGVALAAQASNKPRTSLKL